MAYEKNQPSYLYYEQYVIKSNSLREKKRNPKGGSNQKSLVNSELFLKQKLNSDPVHHCFFVDILNVSLISLEVLHLGQN